jgi:phosphate transport system ATP-binding protein
MITTESLTVRYGSRVALDAVSLVIAPKQITAIVGPSGCGKSTFLACLNRLTDLVPTCRVQGAIRVDGTDVSNVRTDVVALRRRVGMIFQRPNPFPMSIRANVELALREHGMRDRAERARAVETALRDVGLWDEVHDRLEKSALTLSGGQQQRLCIARALALRPEVLLFDEPCSALDPIASGVVEDRIASLRGKYTVVIVTHNLAQARRIADSVALFWVTDGAGRLVEHAPTKDFFERPQDELTRAYVSGARG